MTGSLGYPNGPDFSQFVIQLFLRSNNCVNKTKTSQ